MEKEMITLSGVPETLLIPLYARALESRKEHPVFYDAAAVRIIDAVDYDFAKHGKNKMNMWGCAARTVLFDREAAAHIERYPDCCVVNLACGLDDRFHRLDNGRIRWYNVDFPQVIDLRRELLEPCDRVTDIPASVFDYEWMERIANHDHTLIIAEGFLMYVTAEEVQSLFSIIAGKFTHTTLLLELMTKWMVDHQKLHDTTKLTEAVFKWGVEKTEEFTRLCPQFRMTGEYNFTDAMRRFSPVFMTLASPMMRSKNNRLGKFEQ